MSISLVFSEKPKTENKQKAIEILSAIPHDYKDGKYFVNSDIINWEINQLLAITCFWKTTEVFINEKKIKTKTLQSIFQCIYNYNCRGVCRYYFENYFSVIKIKGWGVHPNFLKICPFLKYSKDGEFHIDIESFDRYLVECTEILQFCHKYNMSLTYEEFRKLPKNFKFDASSTASEVDRGEKGHPGSTPIKMKEISKSNITVQNAIYNGIIFTSKSKFGGEEIIFRIRLLGFDRVNPLDIDRFDEIAKFERHGVLVLLKCEIMNLSKRNIYAFEISDVLRILDDDDFQFTIDLDNFLNENTKFGEKVGLKGTITNPFRPKMKKTVTFALYLPYEENQTYYLGTKGGTLEEL